MIPISMPPTLSCTQKRYLNPTFFQNLTKIGSERSKTSSSTSSNTGSAEFIILPNIGSCISYFVVVINSKSSWFVTVSPRSIIKVSYVLRSSRIFIIPNLSSENIFFNWEFIMGKKSFLDLNPATSLLKDSNNVFSSSRLIFSSLDFILDTATETAAHTPFITSSFILRVVLFSSRKMRQPIFSPATLSAFPITCCTFNFFQKAT